MTPLTPSPRAPWVVKGHPEIGIFQPTMATRKQLSPHWWGPTGGPILEGGDRTRDPSLVRGSM